MLFVDVGGEIGHDVEAFKDAFPHQEGGLIVQYLPDMMANIRQPVPGVETMKHGLFTPQPVKGLHLIHRCVDLMGLIPSDIRCKNS